MAQRKGRARMMKRIFLGGLLLAGVLALCAAAYAWGGWRDGIRDTPELKQRAAALKAAGQGPETLGAAQLALLIKVEDPTFYNHNGVEHHALGAGRTTLTQSLAKRLAFKSFRKGIGKIRQTAYARALERGLTKDEILTLFLATAQMGRTAEGWTEGFHAASVAVYGKAPGAISDAEFLRLIAVGIAPGELKLMQDSPKLTERMARIQRLDQGTCQPLSTQNVWLEGCAER
jgi:monofunctional glycosyltransferase